MIQVESRKTLAGLEMLEAGIVQAAALSLRAGIAAAEKSAKSTTLWKDRTGETRGSIRGEYEGLSRGGFVHAGGASKVLENGTRAHAIHGNPILRFVVNGEVVYRHMVRHPGTSPRPFMAEARMVGETALRFASEYYVSEAIRRAR